ncbi:MAG: hypothetical protein E3J23_01975 [Candidatus Stahlbacteria bacterium]|nr:MAG: hypothetical protein E3J23_01975 [Candidatus Stahlbacteria bacterium]
MFSLLKRLFPTDPLKEKLKWAKKRKKIENKLFWKIDRKKQKEEKRIKTFIDNDICPTCGEAVKLTITTDDDCTDNHYKCTNCSFEKHYYCDDEDGEW